MENDKLIDLQRLNTFKNNINKNIQNVDEKSFKAVECNDNIIKLYKNEDKSDASPTSITLLPATSFQLQASDWKSLSTERNSCNYYAEIPVADLTSNDYARVDFSFDSMPICKTAEISPSGESQDGKIIVYAKNSPTATISGVYIVQKGSAG